MISAMNEQNRKVCVLCNLKPVAMRGIKSHAMVLAASNEDHTRVRRSTLTLLTILKLEVHYHDAAQKSF